MEKLNFTNWKRAINEIVKKEIDNNLDDLPDLDYRLWYDNDNLTPKQVAFIVIGEYYKDMDNSLQFMKDLMERSKNNLV